MADKDPKIPATGVPGAVNPDESVPAGGEISGKDLDQVVGGKAKPEGSLDAGIHFKYDIKAQK